MKPPLPINILPRLLLILVVAHKHIAAPNTQLPPRFRIRRKVVHLGNIHQLVLIAHQRRPNPPQLMVPIIRHRRRRTGLRQPIPLQHMRAKTHAQKLQHFGINRRRPRQHQADSAAQLGFDLVKHEIRPERHPLPPRQSTAASLKGLPEKRQFEPARSLNRRVDLVVEAIKDARNPSKQRRLQLENIIRQLGNHALEKPQRGPVRKKRRLNNPLKTMRQRQKRKINILLPNINPQPVDRIHRRNHILVRDHHPLRVPSRPARIHQNRQILSLGRVVRARMKLAQLQKGLHRQQRDAQQLELRNVALVRLLKADDMLQTHLAPAPLFEPNTQLRELVLAAERNRHLSMLQNKLDGSRPQRVVQSNSRQRIRIARLLNHNPLCSVDGADANLGTARDP
eukprot:Sdes_comp15613_c0_seq1m4610